MENESIVSAVSEKTSTAPLTRPDTATVATRDTRKSSAPKKMSVQRERMIAFLLLIVVVLFAVAYHFRGLVIAATVNGSPISRLAIIRELEQRSGRQALDALINEKLIRDAAAEAKIIVSATDIDTEIANIRGQMEQQGTTLEEVLVQQGMSEADVRKQITLQKTFEKILADKISVTDEEASTYMSDNKLTPPQGSTPDDFKARVKEQLQQQKFGTAASTWITEAKTKADVHYLVGYGAPTPAPTTTETDQAE